MTKPSLKQTYPDSKLELVLQEGSHPWAPIAVSLEGNDITSRFNVYRREKGEPRTYLGEFGLSAEPTDGNIVRKWYDDRIAGVVLEWNDDRSRTDQFYEGTRETNFAYAFP
ncbi:hypothetical protein HYU17_04750 [Candidatus Woesearchaeota archaeon]|nr:hypothetical protein [Candidatus Woesearchaeota archaeon]